MHSALIGTRERCGTSAALAQHRLMKAHPDRRKEDRLMANLNKVMLMGNLTRDVEIRTAGSSQVGGFGIAVNRKWQGQDGQMKEEVTFVDCEAWGKTAEVMAKYLSKGRPVFVEGRLKLDQWDDKETGQKRSKMKVVVETFQFIDSKAGGGGGGGQSQSSDDAGYVQTPTPNRAPARGNAPRPAPSPASEQINPDDIPF
jgi:single-strand DNA-binding protein